LRPVDSEHSAIWQCLPHGAYDSGAVRQILLTASGGPFRGMSIAQMDRVNVQQALNHPTWTMGTRITIDSATLMNKGFELIEAAWLFKCPIDRISIVIHPQSIVHSMVEFNDGNIIANFASHDMRLPIQYALTFPDRPAGPGKRLALSDMACLVFEPPDFEAFPGPAIAREAARSGGLYPAVLSRADELLVAAFLEGRISFNSIAKLVQAALDAFDPQAATVTLEAIHETDDWTSRYVAGQITSRAAP
jgi:1-deoxy-D-xylulose-5-phosphate reductoisomerase